MRRAVAAGVILSLLAATAAWADETITARPPNEFAAAVTTIDQGEKVTLQNVDIVAHDVTAADVGDDGKPLFRSQTVSAGSSGPVEGTEYLTTGSYPFVCTIHPGMDATLEVTSAGAPVPRPEPAAAELNVRVASKKLRRVVRKRKLKVRVSSGPGRVALKGRAKSDGEKVRFKRRSVAFDEAGTRTVALRLSKAAARALRGNARAKVAVTGTAEQDGETVRDRARRTLR